MGKSVIFLLSITALVLGAGVSAAGFDIDAYCKEAARGNRQVEQVCRRREQEAEEILAKMFIPAWIKRRCVEAAWSAGGSYQAMAACVKKEMGEEP